MTKATAKEGKKRAKGGARGPRKSADFEAVRTKISTMVGSRAVKLVESTISEANKGQFAAMKYLFEMTGLYPAAE